MDTGFRKNFCQSCVPLSDNCPKCIINKIPIKVSLEGLLKGNQHTKFEDVFVCPINAQTYEDNKMLMNSKCNSCKLCYSLCVHNYPNVSPIPEVNEKAAFSSLKNLNIVLSGFIKEYKFYNEVFAPGNCRSKRIDIVAINNEKLLLIKVAKENEKNGFYIRSYTEILKAVSELTQKINVNIVILMPRNSKNEIEKVNENTHIVPFVELEKFINS